MPTKRTVRTRQRRSAGISDLAWRFLNDASTDEDRDTLEHFILEYNELSLHTQHRTETLWRLHGDEVTAIWIKHKPGTRPRCWWRFSAPLKTDQRGKRDRYPLTQPRQVIEGPGPLFERGGEYGVPQFRFRLERDRETVKIESQAAYLKRHGLLTPAEKRRLRPSHFEPEHIQV